ncbi:helix-turn-helix domain-containing protein [Nonomuraea sp. NPDC000554]|uniref:helix-turn-helix transcriptional regulator n=1 Tax=Nonomuraea sp. NPDC000554 TaxID=3154259 RepID=UPI003317F512
MVSLPDVRWAERGGLLLKQARHAASMKQSVLASVSGTSRTTLSAYEHGRKSPTLETAGRILDAAGFRLVLEPKVEFARVGTVFVPNRLPRLGVDKALATMRFRDRVYDLADRAARRDAYTALLREGTPQEILDHVDGVLLVELWPELALPPAVRAAWLSLVQEARAC